MAAYQFSPPRAGRSIELIKSGGRFAHRTIRALIWCRRHWCALTLGGSLFIALGGILLWQQHRREKQEIAASALRFRALQAEQTAPVAGSGETSAGPSVRDVMTQYPTTATATIAALQLAARAIQRQEWAEAIQWLKPIAELSAKGTVVGLLAREGLAAAYEGSGNLHDAARLYEGLANEAANADFVEAARGLIRVLVAAGKTEEAKAFLTRFAALHITDEAVKEFQETEWLWIESSAGGHAAP